MPAGHNPTALIVRGIFTTEAQRAQSRKEKGSDRGAACQLFLPGRLCSRNYILASREETIEAGREEEYRIQDPEPFFLSLRLCVLCGETSRNQRAFKPFDALALRSHGIERVGSRNALSYFLVGRAPSAASCRTSRIASALTS
jgi:hypothetical protein